MLCLPFNGIRTQQVAGYDGPVFVQMSGGTYGLWVQQSTKYVNKEEVKSNSIGTCGRN